MKIIRNRIVVNKIVLKIVKKMKMIKTKMKNNKNISLRKMKGEIKKHMENI